MVVSLLTIFSASIIACVEVDLKKLVAISTLSQLGMIIFILSFGGLYLCFFHIVNHALFKSLLFLVCGIMILLRIGRQDRRFLGNRFLYRKSVSFILFLSVTSLIGLPFLSGFFSKDIMIEFLLGFGVDLNILSFFLLSCVLSIIYCVKLLLLGQFLDQVGFSMQMGLFSKVRGVLMGLLYMWSVCYGKFNICILIISEAYILYFSEKLIGVFLLIGGALMFMRKLSFE